MSREMMGKGEEANSWHVQMSPPGTQRPTEISGIFSPQDSENSGDSGYPSEKRGELDDPEPREQVGNSWEIRPVFCSLIVWEGREVGGMQVGYENMMNKLLNKLISGKDGCRAPDKAG